MEIRIFVRKRYGNHKSLVNSIASLLKEQSWDDIPVVVVNVDSDSGFAEARKMGVFVVPTIVIVGNRGQGPFRRWDGEQPTPDDIAKVISDRSRKERRVPAC